MKALNYTELSPFDISQFIHDRHYHFRRVPEGQTILVELATGRFLNSQGKPSRNKVIRSSGTALLEELKKRMADRHSFDYTFVGVMTERGHFFIFDCVTGEYTAQPQEFRELTLRVLYPQGGGRNFSVIPTDIAISNKNAMVRSLEEGTTDWNLHVVCRYAPYSNREYGNYYMSKPLPQEEPSEPETE